MKIMGGQISLFLSLLLIALTEASPGADVVDNIWEKNTQRTNGNILAEDMKLENSDANEDLASQFICPDKITTFSAGPDKSYYYACAKPGTRPLVKKCPPSHTYWAKKQKCRKSPGASQQHGGRVRREVEPGAPKVSDLETVVEPVLGRSVYLGSLFDGRRNAIMDAESLWSEDTVEKHTRYHNAMSSHVSFSGAMTSSDRVGGSKLSDRTKLEVLSDMVQVGNTYTHFFYRQISCLAFTLKFWPKIKQLLSDCPAQSASFFTNLRT